MLRRLGQHALRVADAAGQDGKQRERDLRVALEDPAEVPALDADAGRGFYRAGRRRARELVEQRHLAEDVAGPEHPKLLYATVAVLDDLDLPRADDEDANAGVALTDDLVTGGVLLLDRRIGDGLKRLLIEVLEPRHALEEVGVRRHGRDAKRTGDTSHLVTHRIEVAKDVGACAATVPIQEEVWSGDVVVPPQLMLAAVHNGGFVALGYVAGDERPAGFVFGLVGIYDYHFRHHSHMLAVREPYRGSGLAQALKEAQRDHCLEAGFEIVAWTMDPLEARNARFNFGKLGAYTREYHRDFYGEMPDKLNAGLPSDRIYVEWPIGHDRTYKRLKGEDAPPSLEDAEREAIPYLLRGAGARPAEPSPPSGQSHLLVEIPANFQELKADDRAAALAWRLAARTAFEGAFAKGYAAVEFLRGADGRCAYLLLLRPVPGGAGAQPPREAGAQRRGAQPR